MKSNTPLEYAMFQLSPKRSRCELFISSNGNIEKLASGLVKPFVSHLKVVEEQVVQALQSFKLEVERRRNAETWFTKGTLERFVRFVSTPEVLEMVNTFDAEMSQLEAAHKIYSQGAGDQLSGAGGGDGNGTVAGSDATKKELLRAIDVRLAAVRQDLITACSRASAAGFNRDAVSELQLFSERFGAHRLNEACSKFISLCQRRAELINAWKPSVADQVIRASWGSDMSIDDPTEDLSGPHNVKAQQIKQQHHPADQEQQQNKLSDPAQTNHLSQSKLPTFKQADSSLLKEQQNENKEEVKKEDSVNESTPSQPSQPARRLSVQDRINLFENKQKENSGGKPVSSGKPAELRRLSSDVSSAPAPEKAVLRRWSGASDMSIDLGNDKKENSTTDSPLCTPSSSSVSQPRSSTFLGSLEDNKEHKGLNDSVDSVKVETKIASGFKDQVELQKHASGSMGKEEDVTVKVNWKDQLGLQAQLWSLSVKGEQAVSSEQGSKEEKLKSSGEERNIVTDQVGSGISSTFSDRVETVAVKNQAGLQGHGGNFAGRGEEADFATWAEDVKLKDQPPSQSRYRGSQAHTRTLSGQFECGFGLKNKELKHKDGDSYQSATQPQLRSFAGEVEQLEKKNIALSAKQPVQLELSEISRMKVQKPVSAGTEQIRKQQVRKDERGSAYGSDKMAFGNKVIERQDSIATVQTPSTDQVQRVRQSKGNQERNDELQMKANELEKLFAEHKLRVPGDQTGSTRRSKPTEMQVETGASSHHRKQVTVKISPTQFQDKKTVLEPVESSSDMENFSTPVMKRVDQQGYSSSLGHNFSELSFSDDSRGKFYEKYMQKRDAKLREEWSTKRGEKEAKLKALQDTLERSRAEMKAKFSESADRQDSVSTARRRAEKLKSFNFRSSMKKEQQPVEFVLSEEDEDGTEYPEQKYYGQDFASRSFQNKKFLANRNLSSSTPCTTAAPAPRSAAKNPNPSSGRRRMQSENPLVQSVPNFSDFRKENTKPSSGVSKPANRLQGRNYARSKSTNEETPLAKEEKPRRSQSLRKSSSIPVEYKDFPPLDSDGVVLTPLKFDKEQTELSYREKFSKSVDSKTFLRKGNGTGAGSIAKMKASMASETSRDEEFEETPFDAEDSVDVVKEEQEEDLETMDIEDSANMDNEQSRLSQESDKMGMSESENGDSQRYPSQIDTSSVGELPASVPSSFHAVGSMHESPGESPVSWNSRMHHPFSYIHETSDVDASMDSPIGSPASWNSHSLTQTEADAARMRKKWGTAQKPLLVANSSHNQSRKDMTKGFKRLLKFGRKNRGSESLVDCVSATTSEGDDDTEDGRDPFNRSSEDLRKSRMAFTQGHPSDDGFNERELLNEQVQALHSSIPAPPANFKLTDDHISGSSIKAPRSFFSLSTFRSKGSDSKLRLVLDEKLRANAWKHVK